ncbi:O-antigen ligase family protein [Leptobacterium sp. I13]|uniref:O-antigen ligase family protein n=1 Tax=Leptobacterium meishanense TaxID=3128904 RepID=UPI0030ED4862
MIIKEGLYKKGHIFILCIIATSLVLPMIFNNLAIGLFLLLFFKISKRSNKTNNIQLYILPLIIIFLDVAAIFISNDIQQALYVIEKRTGLIIFSFGFMLMPKISNKNLSTIFKFFVYSVSAICVVSLFLALLENFEQYGYKINYQSIWIIGYHNLSGQVGFHATYLSNYILFSLGILLFHKGENFKWNNKIKYILVAFLITYFMLLAVRTTFISLFLLILYYVYQIYKNNKIKLLMAFSAVILGLLFIFLNSTMMKERFEDIFSIGKSQNISRFGGIKIRMYNWKAAYNVYKENPIIGVGNGDLQEHLDENYRKLNQNKFDLIGYNSHNQYLNELAAKGVLGLLSILLFLLLPLYIGIKNKNKMFIVLMSIHIISFLTENLLNRNKGIIFLIFFYGLLCSNYEFNKSITSEKHESSTNT